MAEFYVNDGAPRKAKQLYFNDGAIRTVKEAWFNDGTAVRKVYSGAGTASPINTTVQSHKTGGGLSTMSMNVRRDGTWDVTGTAATPSGVTSGVWCTPTGASAGDPFFVRMDSVSGDNVANGAAHGTWLQLNADRTWTMNCPPFTDLDGTFTLKFSLDGGATVLNTGTVEFIMTND